MMHLLPGPHEHHCVRPDLITLCVQGLDGAFSVFVRHAEERSSKLVGAAMRDDEEAVIAALHAGDDPDAAPGTEQRTALMWAASLG